MIDRRKSVLKTCVNAVSPAAVQDRAKKILNTIAVLMAAWMLSVDASAETVKLDRAWEGNHILAVLEVTDVRDGIDPTEARALAEAYFTWSEGFDGGLWSFQRDGNWWRFETLVGPEGVAGQPIRIHIKKGWITKRGGKLVQPTWTVLFKWYRAFLAAAELSPETEIAPAESKEELAGESKEEADSESEPKRPES